jgi:hypothetical protein
MSALMKADSSLPLSGRRPRTQHTKPLDGVETVKVAIRFGKSHPVFLFQQPTPFPNNAEFREPVPRIQVHSVSTFNNLIGNKAIMSYLAKVLISKRVELSIKAKSSLVDMLRL